MLQMLPRARGASRHLPPSFLLSCSSAPRARGNICNNAKDRVAVFRVCTAHPFVYYRSSKKIVVQRRNVALQWQVRGWYSDQATP
jgi:hypothetical protein